MRIPSEGEEGLYVGLVKPIQRCHHPFIKVKACYIMSKLVQSFAKSYAQTLVHKTHSLVQLITA
ncbi:hypothetical protein CD191_08500 [Paenibacillus odorifer]|uniref:Uncharacterized protein n=1 Tax=Paenibacillus odorifer TaxID=189426 RepID=A0AAD0P2E9_9BACL|nr:hypothetical protein CD191_08500 [Paenibacillus odorifer]